MPLAASGEIVKNRVPASEMVTSVVPIEKTVWTSASLPKGWDWSKRSWTALRTSLVKRAQRAELSTLPWYV